MKKKIASQRVFIILLVMAIMTGTATIHAEGLLPSLTETVGIAMPSLGEALGRYPDSETENADGSITELYTNISETDFDTFSVYLKRQGAELADYSVQNGILTAEIRARGASFRLEYSSKSSEASVIYPAGTFDERTKSAKTHFNAGQKLLEEGKTDEAFAELLVIPQFGEYGPAVELLRNNDDLAAAAAIVAAREAKLAPYREAGSVVTFGTYPQTAEGNDRTPIEWIVLEYDETNHKALLLSRYGLEVKRYDPEFTGDVVTWENCSLRNWLNSEFMNNAFIVKEQSAILITEVDNSSSQCYGKLKELDGNNTQDKIFLLSYAEAKKYFDITYLGKYNLKSRVSPTDYAINIRKANIDSKSWTEDGKPAAAWWLRSPAQIVWHGSSGKIISYNGASLVGSDGALTEKSVGHDWGGNVVRPALWLNLESDIF